MKKNILLYLIILLSILTSYGQNSIKEKYSYTIGKPYKIYNSTYKYYFQKGNRILSIKIEKNLFAIQKFDSDKLELLSLKEYDNFNGDIEIEGLLEVKGRFYFFYSLWTDYNRYGELRCREIDFDKGEFVNKDFKVLSLKDKLGYNYATKYINFGNERDRMHLTFSKENIKKFTFLKSKDESKLVILYSVMPKIKSDKKTMRK